MDPAHAPWHFARTFLEVFPKYNPHGEKVSLWTESFRWMYDPVYTNFFQTQNEKGLNGSITAPGPIWFI